MGASAPPLVFRESAQGDPERVTFMREGYRPPLNRLQ